jgi:hypothetical protein
LVGYNFFTPLSANPPKVALLTVTGGVTRSMGTLLPATATGAGDNNQGRIRFILPPAAELPRNQPIFVDVWIRCNPATPEGEVDRIDDYRGDTRELKQLVLADEAPQSSRLVVAFKDGAEIRLLEKTGNAPAQVRSIMELEESDFRGVSISADGKTLAVCRHADAIIVGIESSPPQIRHVLRTSDAAPFIPGMLANVSLNEDGTKLVALASYNDSQDQEIQEIRVASITTGVSPTWRTVDRRNFPVQVIWQLPVISPNGQHIAYVAGGSDSLQPMEVLRANFVTGSIDSTGVRNSGNGGLLESLYISDDGSIAGDSIPHESDQQVPFIASPSGNRTFGSIGGGWGANVYGLSGNGRRMLVRSINENSEITDYRVIDVSSGGSIRSIDSVDNSFASITRDGRFVLHIKDTSSELAAQADFELVNVETNERQLIGQSIQVTGELYQRRKTAVGGSLEPTIVIPTVALAAPGPI